jgi:putative transposase
MAKKKAKYQIGGTVYYVREKYSIHKILDFNYVLLTNHKSKYIRAAINEISINPPEIIDRENKQTDILNYTEEQWEEAKERFEIIKPIIDLKLPVKEITKISKKNKVSVPTIYRWIKRYNDTGTLTSLIPEENNGGKGKSRLNEELEIIMNSIIHKEYLNPQKLRPAKVYEKVLIECKNAKITPPNSDTVRRRIKSLSEYLTLSKRGDKKKIDHLYKPIKGHFPGANTPLSVVQIDHTILDIILVDEKNRQPIGRPWITLAIDVYSRMIPGFHISFDPPGAGGTGICVANSILPKDNLLANHEISGEWPCWGIMDRLHMDNAKEFHGNMLKKAAEEYGIDISWRPVATPHWGGHIERLLGTLLREIHTLPGTTFSNIKDRKDYDSEGKASLTLPELEKWLTEYIVNIYHKRIHSGIGTSPLAKYREGIFGSSEQSGVGLPSRIIDEKKLRLDFLPYFERSILRYGVLIDHINYYSDVFRKYINAVEYLQNKSRTKRKFIFRRDPRDISVIWFWEPELKEYFEIPYANGNHPPMSIWDYNLAVKLLKNQDFKLIDEVSIFSAHEKLNKIAHESISKTNKAKRNLMRSYSRKSINKESNKTPVSTQSPFVSIVNVKNITPYED